MILTAEEENKAFLPMSEVSLTNNGKDVSTITVSLFEDTAVAAEKVGKTGIVEDYF